MVHALCSCNACILQFCLTKEGVGQEYGKYNVASASCLLYISSSHTYVHHLASVYMALMCDSLNSVCRCFM